MFLCFKIREKVKLLCFVWFAPSLGAQENAVRGEGRENGAAAVFGEGCPAVSLEIKTNRGKFVLRNIFFYTTRQPSAKVDGLFVFLRMELLHPMQGIKAYCGPREWLLQHLKTENSCIRNL